MKKKNSKTRYPKLTRREIRDIECCLGVFLDSPLVPVRSTNQQFGVYDEIEEYVGDICADSAFFTYDGLEEKISNLFPE